MKHFKGIIIIVLLAVRMLYSVEIQNVSSIILDCSETLQFSNRNAQQSSVETPHKKKKIKISVSLHEKKEKHKTSPVLKSPFEKFTDVALTLPHSKSVAYFEMKSAYCDASNKSLYRLHLF